MLRAILSAIGRGLGRAFAFGWQAAWWLAFLPFRLFGGSPRMPAPQIDVAAIKERMAGAGIPTREQAQSLLGESLRRNSNIAMVWIASSLRARAPQPFPTAMSKTMSRWLQGLDYKQMVLLTNAGPAGVFEHITGKKQIELVPAFKDLPAVIVKFPPAPRVAPGMPRMMNVPQPS
jgi:hypothetical protein